MPPRQTVQRAPLPGDNLSYVVSGLGDVKDYVRAMALVSSQTGKDLPGKYDGRKGIYCFSTPVEIDMHPLEKAGFQVNILPRPRRQ